jgi:hypothetical protein
LPGYRFNYGTNRAGDQSIILDQIHGANPPPDTVEHAAPALAGCRAASRRACPVPLRKCDLACIRD